MAKKSRRCLKCDKLFSSIGPGNRICPPCDKKNRYVSGIGLNTEIHLFHNESILWR